MILRTQPNGDFSLEGYNSYFFETSLEQLLNDYAISRLESMGPHDYVVRPSLPLNRITSTILHPDQ